MTFVAASARGGTRSGIAAALGVRARLLAAVVGLAALIASSQAAFTVLKWVGAAYPVYLGGAG